MKGERVRKERRQTKQSNLKAGDKSFLKRLEKNKFTTKFQATPYTVIEREGSQIVAKNKQHQVTPNVHYLKNSEVGRKNPRMRIIIPKKQKKCHITDQKT